MCESRHRSSLTGYNLSGGLQQLQVDVSGRVVVPKFEFDVDRLEYGVVSFSYPFSKTLTLTNTSDIPLSFVLRVPEDEKDEFSISPAAGKLLPHHSQEVHLHPTWHSDATRTGVQRWEIGES